MPSNRSRSLLIDMFSSLSFTFTPVTLLTALVYGLVFLAVFVTDETPDVPTDQDGLSLDTAFLDLEKLTAHPHPVLSHVQDDTRAYIVSRLQSIVSSSDYIHINHDLTSSASYVSGTLGSYFEGINILVKVDGTEDETENDGVVFSAHVDSVSTGPGATDDAVGIVTMLQLVEYLSHPERRPRRTAVFLFNSGEEDGLNGSHMFFEHAWSNLTSVFLNLEGAGAGGRPIVFRSSSLGPINSFGSPSLDHVHANVLCKDAYDAGVLRSRTDYQVFNRGLTGVKDGLQGADFAFYQRRSVYHTPRDSIAELGTDEARKSVWAMLDGARGAGLSLLNDERQADDRDAGVYFDILGKSLVAFPRSLLLGGNISLLILGPVSLVALLAWIVIAEEDNTSLLRTHARTQHITAVVAGLLSWGRFWVSLLATVLGQLFLVLVLVKINPFVIYSYANTFLACSLSLTYLTLVLPLQGYQIYGKVTYTANSQKLACLLSLFLVTWIFLFISTVAVGAYGLNGFYFFTFWYLASWASSIVGLAEAGWRAKNKRESGLVYGSRPENGHHDEEDTDVVDNGDHSQGPVSENTPLIHNGQGSRRHESTGEVVKDYIEENVWWIGQLILLVPFPVILMSQIQLLAMHALRHSMADGSSPIPVHAGICFLSILIGLNITPFAHKISCLFTRLIIAVFVLSALYSLLAFPFTLEYPLKVFFQQTISLVLPSDLHPQGYVSDATTYLTAPSGYVDNLLIPSLPNSRGKDLRCHIDNTARAGLLMCGFDSMNLLPSPGGESVLTLNATESLYASSHLTRSTDWIQASFKRHGSHNATISIQGRNTRVCRLQFDKPISFYRVHGSSGHFQPGYGITEDGVTDLPLWSREWDREFVVDIGWNLHESEEAASAMSGTVACEWAEYASATAGTSWAAKSARIPAMEEMITFLPLWAVPIKWTYGLVEAEAKFTL